MKQIKENIENATLGCRLGRAYQIMLGQLAVALKAAGLDITTNEYLVLRAVYSAPGLQQCEIVDMVGKDKAAVCRCVAAMEKRNLVTTEQISHKCLKVYPTDRSLEIKPAIEKVARERHAALMRLTTPGDLEIFSQIIDKIIESKTQ